MNKKTKYLIIVSVMLLISMLAVMSLAEAKKSVISDTYNNLKDWFVKKTGDTMTGNLNIAGNEDKAFEALTISNSLNDGAFMFFPRLGEPLRGFLIGHQARPGSSFFGLEDYDKVSYIRASGRVSQNIEIQPGKDESGNYGNINLLTYGGKTGIGTLNPEATLDVNGNVLVREYLKIGGSSEISCNEETEGTIYYDETMNKHRACDGTAWHDLY